MHHLTCGISSLLHSVNLILFTVLLVHLILRISPHHSHHLHSHHLSLPLPSTPDLKLNSSLSQILSSVVTLIPSGLTSRILTCTELKGHWRCLFWFLATCARLSCILSFRVYVKLCYRIVSYRKWTRIVSNNIVSHWMYFSTLCSLRWFATDFFAKGTSSYTDCCVSYRLSCVYSFSAEAQLRRTDVVSSTVTYCSLRCRQDQWIRRVH